MELSEELVRRFRGPFRDEKTGVFTYVEATSEKLELNNGDGSTTVSCGYWRYAGLRLNGGSGNIACRSHSSNLGGEAVYDQVPPSETPKGGLRSYAGDYQSDEILGIYEVVVEGRNRNYK